MFHTAIVQSVLLYGCKTWVLMPKVFAALDGFHKRVSRQICAHQSCLINVSWHYPPIVEALEMAGLFSIEHYVLKR